MVTRIHVCSYCGAKYRADEDEMIDGGWARFELQIGKGECRDVKTRTSCTNANCRELMHDEFFESFASRGRKKKDKELEALQ